MPTTHETGRKAETIAIELLVNKGYKILHRNWQYHHKEIDIAAMHNSTLVIAEVKSRPGMNAGSPSEMISTAKMRHLTAAAEAYIGRYNLDLETRFDVIVVTFTGEKYYTEHIEGAFIPGVNW